MCVKFKFRGSHVSESDPDCRRRVAATPPLPPRTRAQTRHAGAGQGSDSDAVCVASAACHGHDTEHAVWGDGATVTQTEGPPANRILGPAAHRGVCALHSAFFL